MSITRLVSTGGASVWLFWLILLLALHLQLSVPIRPNQRILAPHPHPKFGPFPKVSSAPPPTP